MLVDEISEYVGSALGTYGFFGFATAGSHVEFVTNNQKIIISRCQAWNSAYPAMHMHIFDKDDITQHFCKILSRSIVCWP